MIHGSAEPSRVGSSFFVNGVWFFVWVAACSMMPLVSCQAVSTAPGHRVDEPPTYAELAAAHNHRVEQLSRIYARGVVEIVWHDEAGVRRFRQGDVDLYLNLPRHTALRVGKLAETYLWLGSDDERYWLFDLLEEERTLYLGTHDEAHTLHTVPPMALLDLIGLGPLAELAGDDAPPVEFDTHRDAWVVQSWGGGGRVRMYFDRATRLPQRIEVLNADGEPVSVSTIHMPRYRSVPVPGISAAAQPRMATLIDIVSTGEDGVAAGEVKLALGSPTGRVDNQPFDRVFDLERLQRSLRPTRIE